MFAEFTNAGNTCQCDFQPLSPEEACGARKRHEITRVEILGICKIEVRIDWIHNKGTLVGQRFPDLHLLVEISPRDTQLIKARHQSQHVADSRLLVLVSTAWQSRPSEVPTSHQTADS